MSEDIQYRATRRGEEVWIVGHIQEREQREDGEWLHAVPKVGVQPDIPDAWVRPEDVRPWKRPDLSSRRGRRR